ncbi:filamentous hemagglutinin family protein [Pseudomonas sp. TE3786]
MDVHSPLCRLITLLQIGALLANPLASAGAELTVDSATASNTAITQAGNGVPIVSIATPNGSGLSHNRFSDYNVGQPGLILNNAPDAFTSTQLGGVILGNANLAGHAATLILNEVTGSHPSQLQGYTEVAGQGAHVVVANPNGISCDGCGFINTPRVTLSTGTPVIEAGQLRRFEVDQGQIVIAGTGLHAANISQFDLITRSAKLNAALYAQRLTIVTGRNQVDAHSLAASAKPDDGKEKPLLAIDSSALGGMYTGAIRLVGTEAGVGVRLAADMAASGDDIQIDVNGKLSLARVVSAAALTVKAEQIAVTDQAHADGATKIEASGAVDIAASLTSAADLSITAGNLSNHGTLGGNGRVSLQAAILDNQGGLIFSGGDLTLKVDTLTNRLGDLFSLGTLAITATDLVDNRSGSLESAGNLQIQAKRINNQRDVLSTHQEKYAARISELPCSLEYGAGDCDGGKANQVWQIVERDRLQVSAATERAYITAGGNLSLISESLLNQASAISAAGDMSIKVAELQNLGVQPGEYETSRVFTSERTRNPEALRKAASTFTALYWPQSDDPLGLLAALNRFIGETEREQSQLRSSAAINVDGETYSAIIQAGGKVDISTSGSFDSSVVRPTYAYVAGGSLASTEMAETAIAAAISRNPQLAPDLTQQPSLPGFNLPSSSNGLFRLNSDGSHPYLVETNPALTTLRGFLSSDYLLAIIGYNPALTQRRLGDGLYEQRLVQQAVIARTGKRFLDGLSSDEEQFRYLMDNAIASKQALNLVPGIALSAEQVAALTHDIVWLQEQEVAGQKVLVPVLYLAQAKDRLAPNGALVQGQDVTLISASDLSNSGTLRAGNNLSISAANISNRGLMQANEQVALQASDSIRNSQGGIIAGKDVSASALTGDIVNERSITTHDAGKEGFERREDVVDSPAGIEASNGLTLSAGRDIVNQGGNLRAGGDAELRAGRDLLILSQSETEVTNNKDRKGYSKRSQTLQYGAGVQVGGDLTAEAGRDLAVVASTVKAGRDMQLSAAEDLTIAAAADETTSDSYRKSGGKKVKAQDSVVHQQAAVIEAGSNLNIEAGNNLSLVAGQVKAGDGAFLYAGDQLALLSAEDSEHHLFNLKKKGDRSSKETRKDETTRIRNLGTNIVTGGDLRLISEGDQYYQKAKLQSGGGLTLDSGGAITFEAVKDLDQQSHERSDSDLAWNSAKGKGSSDETLRQSELIAKGETIIRAVNGIHIDIKQVDRQSVSQTIDAMVAADPNLAWIKEAEKRGEVDWQRVKEIHDSWDYQNSGLGMGAALVIAIVATVLTAGAASVAVAAAYPTSATMAAATTTAAAGVGNVAATAAITSAASTAAVSTINNRGKLSAVSKDIFSPDSLKGYLTAALIAGVGATTDSWGTKRVVEQNLQVVDFGKRAEAYLTNTAVKGSLSGDKNSNTWLAIAGTGALAELYKYSVGRGPDIRPGVERPEGPRFTPLEGNFVPRVIVDGAYVEGNNLGINWPRIDVCSTFYAICHGTPISAGLNQVPGLNSFATIHDSWMTSLEAYKEKNMSVFENLGSMPPALFVNYGALYEMYRPQIDIAKGQKNEKN